MGNSDDLVTRYLAVWNELDEGVRAAAAKDIWAEDALYANQGQEFHGRAGVNDAVSEAVDSFVKQGFVFTLGRFEENHAAARLTWVMVPAAGGDPAATGTQYWVRDANGLIKTDYQFVETA